MNELEDQELKSVHIDVEKGIYEVNGRNISNSAISFNLTFEDGEWSLAMIEKNSYIANNQKSANYGIAKGVANAVIEEINRRTTSAGKSALTI